MNVPFKALDLSNYDSAVPFTEETAAAFIADGYDFYILGCQNPDIARAQAAVLNAHGMACIATYVEPFLRIDAYQATIDGIAIAQELGARAVAGACENGGIDGLDELHAVRGQIEAAGLEFITYAGRGTWLNLMGNSLDFADTKLWFPAYWSDGHITHKLSDEGASWVYGGWDAVSIHQFASTPELAGRNRDRNMVLIWEDDMTDPKLERLILEIATVVAGGADGHDFASVDEALVVFDKLANDDIVELLGINGLNAAITKLQQAPTSDNLKGLLSTLGLNYSNLGEQLLKEAQT